MTGDDVDQNNEDKKMKNEFALRTKNAITTVFLADGTSAKFADIDPRALRRDLNRYIKKNGSLVGYAW